MVNNLLFVEGLYIDHHLVKLSFIEFDIYHHIVIDEGEYDIYDDRLKLIRKINDTILISFDITQLLSKLSYILDIEKIKYIDILAIAFKYLDSKIDELNPSKLLKYYGIYKPVNKYFRDDNLANVRLFKALIKDFKIDVSKWINEYSTLSSNALIKELKLVLKKIKSDITLSNEEIDSLKCYVQDYHFKAVIKRICHRKHLTSNDKKRLEIALSLEELKDILKHIRVNENLKMADELKLKVYLEDNRLLLDSKISDCIKDILDKQFLGLYDQNLIYSTLLSYMRTLS